MPNVLWSLDFTPQKPPELNGFAKMLNKIYQQLARVVNGGISFGDGLLSENISGAWGTVADTGTADTDFSVTHNLGRVPVGYLIMTADRATSIYTGSVAWTTTTISLKSSAANAAISLFIL